MKALSTLLKLAQRRLDEASIEAMRLAARIEAMRGEEEAILAREMAERIAAAHDVSLAAFLPAYLARTKAQLTMKRAEIADAEEHQAELKQRLTAAYQEKAKFEQLIELNREREAAERAAAETAALDEAAILRAGRD